MADLARAYAFLLERARDQRDFTESDLAKASGWTRTTPRTYLSKQLRSVIQRLGRGRFRVKRNFIHLTRNDFIKRVSQKEVILPSYTRWAYAYVVNYEFLMPLTREALLRAALDSLFYKNTLEDKICLVGLERFVDAIPKKTGETDQAYAARVARKVSDYFGGYSVTHVNGRFRAADLTTQQNAIGERYIIDETTAVVRFVVPLEEGKTCQGESFRPMSHQEVDQSGLSAEISLVRTLFFNIFAEVVVHSVQGEDQIWLLETFAGNQRLYQWRVDSCD